MKNFNWQLPLSKGDYGFFKSNTTIEDAVKQNIRSVILTRKNERVVMNDYGTNILDKLFNPKTPELKMELENEIVTGINRWVPNTSVQKVVILFKEDITIRSPFYGKMNLTEDSAFIAILYAITNHTNGFAVTDTFKTILTAE